MSGSEKSDKSERTTKTSKSTTNLGEQCMELNKIKSKLEVQLAHATQQYGELKAEYDKLEVKCSKAQGNVCELQKLNASLMAQANEQKQTIDAMKEKIAKLETSQNRTCDELEIHQKESESRMSRINELRAALKDMKAKLAEKGDTVEQLTSDLAANNRKIEQYIAAHEEHEKLSTSLVETESESREYQKKFTTLLADYRASQQMTEEIQEERIKALEQNRRYTDEITALRSRIESLESTAGSLTSDVRSVERRELAIKEMCDKIAATPVDFDLSDLTASFGRLVQTSTPTKASKAQTSTSTAQASTSKAQASASTKAPKSSKKLTPKKPKIARKETDSGTDSDPDLELATQISIDHFLAREREHYGSKRKCTKDSGDL